MWNIKYSLMSKFAIRIYCSKEDIHLSNFEGKLGQPSKYLDCCVDIIFCIHCLARLEEKTKVVIYRVPHNAAMQIYDYKEKTAHDVFGPELVMLRPDEQFTQLSLSGGKPNRPNMIKALYLLLRPDFYTDISIIETANHARLQLQLSYNW